MNELAKFKRMLARGELKEAAQWIKEGPLPFFSERELRATLVILADAILADKKRLGKYHGLKKSPPDYDRKSKQVSPPEWERRIYHAVHAHVGPNGRVKSGTYKNVSLQFGTSESNVKLIYSKYKNS